MSQPPTDQPCGSLYDYDGGFLSCVLPVGHASERCSNVPLSVDGLPRPGAITWLQGPTGSDTELTTPVPQTPPAAAMIENTVPLYIVSLQIGRYLFDPTRIDTALINERDRTMGAAALRYAADRLDVEFCSHGDPEW